MSYLTQNEIANNYSMLSRVSQAVAGQDAGLAAGVSPDAWATTYRRTWAASPGWDEAWESAKVSHPPVEGEPPYDPGADEAVITDLQILSQVQAMLNPA